MTFIACSSAAWGGQQHTPQTMASSSPLSVWWCCGKCGHEWRATVISRTSNKDGCPHCCAADFKPLSVTHPELAAEWHELNKDMIVKKGSRIPNEIVGTPLTPATCSKYVLARCLRCRFYVIFARKGYWFFFGFTSLTRRGPAFRSCYRFCPSRAAGKNVGFSSFLLLFALANTIFKRRSPDLLSAGASLLTNSAPAHSRHPGAAIRPCGGGAERTSTSRTRPRSARVRMAGPGALCAGRTLPSPWPRTPSTATA